MYISKLDYVQRREVHPSPGSTPSEMTGFETRFIMYLEGFSL